MTDTSEAFFLSRDKIAAELCPTTAYTEDTGDTARNTKHCFGSLRCESSTWAWQLPQSGLGTEANPDSEQKEIEENS